MLVHCVLVVLLSDLFSQSSKDAPGELAVNLLWVIRGEVLQDLISGETTTGHERQSAEFIPRWYLEDRFGHLVGLDSETLLTNESLEKVQRAEFVFEKKKR